MRVTICIVSLLIASGCSSIPRTKYSDPNMRVMVDPDSFDTGDYVRIEQALVKSGKWIVVDRGAGFRAAKIEQERLHRNEVDRYSDPEKWAHWGKLYGVGGIIVGHSQCHGKTALFGGVYKHCLQSLAIVNANTGEIIASSELEQSGDRNVTTIALDWTDTVEALNTAYPDHYEPNRNTAILEDYRAVSKEEALRQKELIQNAAGTREPATTQKK
jgi:curli biogenesis system outer membrane secretion channel CsgG